MLLSTNYPTYLSPLSHSDQSMEPEVARQVEARINPDSMLVYDKLQQLEEMKQKL
jgi:hypothetical protein